MKLLKANDKVRNLRAVRGEKHSIYRETKIGKREDFWLEIIKPEAVKQHFESTERIVKLPT